MTEKSDDDEALAAALAEYFRKMDALTAVVVARVPNTPPGGQRIRNVDGEITVEDVRPAPTEDDDVDIDGDFLPFETRQDDIVTKAGRSPLAC